MANNPLNQATVTHETVILVCDDDADARSLIVASLMPLGARIDEVGDGQEAIDYCQRYLPDVIVMDIMMPRVTGLEFTAWFRGKVSTPFVPILLLTALDEVDDRVAGLNVGADDYLTKPFHWRELQARISALLRIKDLARALEKRTAELEAANGELIQAQEKLVKQERQLAVGQLAGSAAHNLGQPLTTMLLNVHVLEKYATKFRGAVAEKDLEHVESAISEVKAQSLRMKEIITKLQEANAERTQSYVGNIQIVDLKLGENKKDDQ